MSDELVPLLRGVTHACAFWLALAATAVLVALAETGLARGAALVYGAGLCLMLAGSAVYHRWKGDPRVRGILRRIDHSTIFVFIAASYTPVCLLVLEGSMRWVVFAGVWVGALGGIALSVAWITAPRFLQAIAYLALGWFAIIAIPQMVARLPLAPLILLAVGGLLYSAGAAIYAAQRPDPWPRVFGFHEVFHALVVAAAVVHFVAMAGWVIPVG
jgi:hemolysin III